MDLRQRMRVIFINNLYLKITIDRNDRKWVEGSQASQGRGAFEM
jgi:hypothetical protein